MLEVSSSFWSKVGIIRSEIETSASRNVHAFQSAALPLIAECWKCLCGCSEGDAGWVEPGVGGV